MIKYIHRNQLDVEKYNTCISDAVNSRIYAYSWYLDIVCDSWNVLVKDDYEAVMPLPTRKKFGISYVYLPPWVQQLGVFSINDIQESLVEEFLISIPKEFKFINVNMNSDVLLNCREVFNRDNYELKLNSPYKNLVKKYTKGRYSNILKAKKNGLTILTDFNLKKSISFFLKNTGENIHINRLDNKKLDLLLVEAKTKDKLMSIAVSNEDYLLGVAIFLVDNKRITYLLSSINNKGREEQAMSYILDNMINRYANSNYILDFEGSQIKDIAFFFRSFGAENKPYNELRIYRNSFFKLIFEVVKFIKKQ